MEHENKNKSARDIKPCENMSARDIKPCEKQSQSDYKKVGLNNVVNNVNNTPHIVFFDVSRKEKCKKYFILKLNKNKILLVTKKEFTNYLESPVIEFRNNFFKFDKGSKPEIMKLIKRLNTHLPLWKPESNVEMIWIEESLMDTIKGIKTSLNFLPYITSVISASNKFVSEEKELIKLFLLDISMVLVKLTDTANFKVRDLIESLINLYRVYCLGNVLKTKWEAQSLLSLNLAIASSFLPNSLVDIIKRMSLFSNTKILDDLTGFFAFYNLISDFFTAMIDMLPFKIPEKITKPIFSLFSVAHYVILNKMSSIYDQWRKDPKIIIESKFRADIRSLDDEVKESIALEEMCKRSAKAKTTRDNFNMLNRAVLAYVSSSRTEPVCFVFEGPPGCMKSVLMNSVINASEETHYSHSTKAIDEGKDFHDTYNNEDIYFMDDVGQQGVSQFRTIINLVSSTKMPLECASAHLKDTKFFNSKKIMLTTNCFSNLTGLTKTDCISDKKALWRRAIVFNFDNTKRDGPKLIGTIQVKHFSLKKDTWMNEFTPDFKEYCEENNINIPESIYSDGRNKIDVIAWMLAITNYYSDMKESEAKNNEIGEEDIQYIKNIAKSYKAEDFTYAREKINVLKEVISDLCVRFTECMTSVTESAIIGKAFQFIFVDVVLPFVICKVFISVLESFKLWFKKPVVPEAAITEHEPQSAESLHNNVKKIASQTFRIGFADGDKIHHACGVISGRYIITTSHTLEKTEGYLIVYKSLEKNHRLLDNVLVKRVYSNPDSDTAVWVLPSNFPSPFKKLKLFSADSSKIGYSLVTPESVYEIDGMRRKPVSIPTPYKMDLDGVTPKYTVKPTDFFYDVHGRGLCGSALLTSSGTYVGHHVAGEAGGKTGAATHLDSKTLEELQQILSTDFNNLRIEAEISDKVFENFSGIKFHDTKISTYTPKTSNIGKSPLYGLFDVSREPANLSRYGPHTVKDVGKKSFVPVVNINNDELDFAAKCVDFLIEPFSEISMKEVINGNNNLAGLNRKSSNGYNCPKSKLDCIDYDKGELTPDFQGSYDKFIGKLKDGLVEFEDVVSVETLKDEVRNVEKDRVPRSFRVARLHFQILMKKIFGSMVANIVVNRWSNEIMVGINPYKEWRQLYNAVANKPAWAGDVKSWDGSMLPQVQQKVVEVLVRKFSGDKDLASKILGLAIFCPVSLNDDTYMTTHSMPSGIFLTAIMNSIINRFYTAMWYYRQVKPLKEPTVCSFYADVGDFVYGDDKLNYLNNTSLKEELNALTMRDFFKSIGMGLTTADKNEIVKPFDEVKDLSFLKRTFRNHVQLNEIVGPLELRTIESSIAWIDYSKEATEVFEGKVSAFQREVFLHGPSKEFMVERLENACRIHHLPFKKLNKYYLENLYKNDDYLDYTEKYGIKIKAAI